MAEKWSRAPKLALWKGEGEGMGRTYVDPTDGDTRHPSVTTILKHEDKSDLVQWAANMVAQKAVDRLDIVSGDPEKAYDRLRFAHNDARDERGWVGSGVHARIEAECEGTWDFPDMDSEQEAMFAQWESFCETYSVRVLLTEFTVRGEGYLGTADALIEYADPFTGETKRAIVDWKTSKSLHDTYSMQLAALSRGLYRLQEVPEGTEGAFLRKGKTRAENSWWVRAEMPEFDTLAMVHLRDRFWSFVEVEHADLYYDAFMAYRQVHMAKLAISQAKKS